MAKQPPAQEPRDRPDKPSYLEAPPGEATRLALQVGGLVARDRRARIGWLLSAGILAIAVLLVGLDLAGLIEVPGLHAMTQVAGLAAPPEPQGGDLGPELTDAEREALRRRLLGGGVPSAAPTPSAAGSTMEAKRPLAASEHDLAESIFADARKKESSVQLQPPSEVRVPNLPEGLTQEAIFSVITESSRALSLCIAQAAKSGERLEGRMEIEMSIGPSGSVVDAQIATAKFNGSVVGNCARTTVKRWRFPRFEGEPVTVVFPIVLSLGG